MDPEVIAHFVLPSRVAQLPVTTLLLRFTSSHSPLCTCICVLQDMLGSLPTTLETIYVEMLVVGGQGDYDLERIHGMNWSAVRQTFNSLMPLRRVHFNFLATSLSDHPRLHGATDDPSQNPIPDASDSASAPDSDCGSDFDIDFNMHLPPTVDHRAAIKDAVMGGLSPLRDNISLGYRYTIKADAENDGLEVSYLQEPSDDN